ncbi:Rdx family-domain-containing protein [Gymnopilus junonius]|uniref:Rdx family-domain-containing protein n=1 Tax=Gymnopilus junonius TaxID=109634 RepID=A0A9P5NP78_GYMJU|nr:Rdx family-domain-containing protein [Gymnopilus junonius]
MADSQTFVFPGPQRTVTIEFCDRVRILIHDPRLHRASWVQTELFLTFPPPTIGAITLVPLNSDDTAGRFRVWVSIPGTEEPLLVWDRKSEGGFPELKVLKQRIRDHLQPGKSLGHSDK